jgi:hypothetical protein
LAKTPRTPTPLPPEFSTTVYFWFCSNKLFSEENNFLFLFFRIETIDGSAIEGEDYEPLNEVLTFEPNEREKEVN